MEGFECRQNYVYGALSIVSALMRCVHVETRLSVNFDFVYVCVVSNVDHVRHNGCVYSHCGFCITGFESGCLFYVFLIRDSI